MPVDVAVVTDAAGTFVSRDVADVYHWDRRSPSHPSEVAMGAAEGVGRRRQHSPATSTLPTFVDASGSIHEVKRKGTTNISIISAI